MSDIPLGGQKCDCRELNFAVLSYEKDEESQEENIERDEQGEAIRIWLTHRDLTCK